MDLMAIRRRLLMLAAAARRILHTITSAAGIVSFSTELAEPLESLACEFAPVQPGGDPSPDNILPISGWTGLSIGRATDGFLCVPQSGTHWEVNGIVCDYIGNGAYWVRGTATATANISIPIVGFTIPAGDGRLFEMKNYPATSGASLVFLTSASSQIDSWVMTTANRTSTGYSAMAGKNVGIIRFAHTSGKTVDYKIAPTFSKYMQTGVSIDWSVAYRRLKDIVFDGSFHYESSVHLVGSDVVTMTISPAATTGMNVFGCYSGTGSSARNFSFFNYRSTSDAYFRYGTVLLRPEFGSTATRTVSFGAGGTSGFNVNVTTPETSFTSTDPAWIGMLPNSTSAHYSGTITGPIKVGDRMQFIPVERVSDGKIGYFDTLNNVFLEPVGTGTPTTSGYEEESYDAGFNVTPGIVYGGTLDVVSGVLTVDRVSVTFDGGSDETWANNNGCFTLYIPGIKRSTSTSGSAKIVLCDTYKNGGVKYRDSVTNGMIVKVVGANNQIAIKDTSYENAAAFKTALESTPIHVVYQLATPLTYQLTPTEVATIIGNNTLWHDAFGGITVSYYDTK